MCYNPPCIESNQWRVILNLCPHHCSGENSGGGQARGESSRLTPVLTSCPPPSMPLAPVLPTPPSLLPAPPVPVCPSTCLLCSDCPWAPRCLSPTCFHSLAPLPSLLFCLPHTTLALPLPLTLWFQLQPCFSPGHGCFSCSPATPSLLQWQQVPIEPEPEPQAGTSVTTAAAIGLRPEPCQSWK